MAHKKSKKGGKKKHGSRRKNPDWKGFGVSVLVGVAGGAGLYALTAAPLTLHQLAALEAALGLAGGLGIGMVSRTGGAAVAALGVGAATAHELRQMLAPSPAASPAASSGGSSTTQGLGAVEHVIAQLQAAGRLGAVREELGAVVEELKRSGAR